MGKSTVVPFGPQHPVLPEPIHFDLELEDEKVVKAIPSIGYVHRGLEKLVEKRGFQEYVYVAKPFVMQVWLLLKHLKKQRTSALSL